MADAVQRLRHAQEAYERHASSSAGLEICCNLLSLSAYIWPTTIPGSLLMKLWMSVKDETLKQLDFYSRVAGVHGKLTAQSCDELDIRLLQTINVFLSQCPDLPYDLLWDECKSICLQLATHEDIEVALCRMYRARQLLQGLLHLMAAHCSNKSLMSNFEVEELSLARVYILLRLTLDHNEENDNLFATLYLFKWNTYRSIPAERFCFQMVVRLFVTETAARLDIIQPAQHLLEELLLVDEEQWSGCLSAILHEIFKVYLDKGPTSLEPPPTKALFRLFSSKAFARAFLDCISLFPDPRKNTASALSAAFQIFELVYVAHAETIVACCLSKAVDEQSDLVLLRLQCLNLVGRIQSHKLSSMEDSESFDNMWTEDSIRNLFTILLSDSSIRVRRSAMQILLPFCASNNIINDKELLEVLCMKARDQDEKVRFMALQGLRNIPVKTLAECLTNADWKALCMRGFAEEKKEVRSLVEALVLDYLMTQFLGESPSSRLQILGFMGEENLPKQHSRFLYDNVESIFDKELEYLSRQKT